MHVCIASHRFCRAKQPWWGRIARAAHRKAQIHLWYRRPAGIYILLQVEQLLVFVRVQTSSSRTHTSNATNIKNKFHQFLKYSTWKFVSSTQKKWKLLHLISTCSKNNKHVQHIQMYQRIEDDPSKQVRIAALGLLQAIGFASIQPRAVCAVLAQTLEDTESTVRALALKILADIFPTLVDYPNLQKSIIAVTFRFETTSFLLSDALSSEIKESVRVNIFGCHLKATEMPSGGRCEYFKSLSRKICFTKIHRSYRSVLYEQFLADHFDALMDAVTEWHSRFELMRKFLFSFFLYGYHFSYTVYEWNAMSEHYYSPGITFWKKMKLYNQ